MPDIFGVFEPDHIIQYLEARGLLKQYQKAKTILLFGDKARVRFKERQPHGDDIWSFRVNKQFRAFGKFDSIGDLIIFRIDNHQ